MQIGALGDIHGAFDAVADIMSPMRNLLVAPVAEAGSPDPQRDADAIFELTIAAMRRYVGSHRQLDPADRAHLVRFCLNGLSDKEIPA
mgnify:CR=1 FL=1